MTKRAPRYGSSIVPLVMGEGRTFARNTEQVRVARLLKKEKARKARQSPTGVSRAPYKPITARYPGRCSHCRNDFRPGAPLLKADFGGKACWVHQACYWDRSKTVGATGHVSPPHQPAAD